jgi:Na+/H+ antiporter NhaB
MIWIKNNYWKLEQVSCILVLRNKQWFGTNIQAIEDLWKIVLEERVTGFSHRAPKQRPAKQSTIQVNKITNLNLALNEFGIIPYNLIYLSDLIYI